MVLELDESNEESLSGGIKLQPLQDIGIKSDSSVVALVLLFANPFA